MLHIHEHEKIKLVKFSAYLQHHSELTKEFETRFTQRILAKRGNSYTAVLEASAVFCRDIKDLILIG